MTGTRGPFLSPRTFVVPMLYAGAALSVVQGLAMISQTLLLMRMNGGEWTQDEAELNDMIVGGVAILFLLLYIATIVAWWRWQLRAAHNIRAFGQRTYEFTPGWTIGYYFVPILNLFKPFRAMKEIDVASDPAVEVDGPQFDLQASSPRIVAWWTFWLLGNFAGQISFRMPSETLTELTAGSAFGIAEAILHIAVCLVAAGMIRRINDNQMIKAGRVPAANV